MNPTSSAPTANTATNIQQTSFSANWSALSGATSYNLDVSANSGFSSFISGYNDLNVGNVNTYSVTGLTCNRFFYYRVRANNSCGAGSNSNTINTDVATTILTNLLSYWKLDGNSNDAVGSNSGSEVNISYNSGEINQGASFNGTSSNIPLGNGLNVSSSITVSAWIKPGTMTNGNEYEIFAKNNGVGPPTNSYTFSLTATGSSTAKFVWRISNGSLDCGYITPSAYSFSSNFVHVVFVYDKTNYKTYINGSLWDTSGSYTHNINQTTDIPNIGSIVGTYYFFTGAIDEVGIWSRAISSCEINQLYNNGAGLQYPF
ncbi:MAG: LamG domain-containing protein [Bacteroidetes bacterium]|nr:LamG domain-containing protein [Bacteroidota bacterium]